jgi:hypothetical protein
MEITAYNLHWRLLSFRVLVFANQVYSAPSGSRHCYEIKRKYLSLLTNSEGHREKLSHRRLILVHSPAFHHKNYTPHGCDVFERIAVERDDVRLHDRLDRTDFILQIQ